jgi:hypothetical protein
VAFRSEICRCLYRFRLRLQFKETVPITVDVVYKATLDKMVQLQTVVDFGKANKEFLEYLYRNFNKPLSRTELDKVIEHSQLGGEREKILRVLEQRWFNEGWSAESFRPVPEDKRSLGWRLYFKLVEEMQRIAEQNGAKLVLFSENDLGEYEWNTHWFRLANDDETRRVWLQPTDLLREFAEQRGIGFVPQRRKYTRWHNDPHPDIAGNEAMASDIFDYLTTKFAGELMAFRSAQRETPGSSLL